MLLNSGSQMLLFNIGLLLCGRQKFYCETMVLLRSIMYYIKDHLSAYIGRLGLNPMFHSMAQEQHWTEISILK